MYRENLSPKKLSYSKRKNIDSLYKLKSYNELGADNSGNTILKRRIMKRNVTNIFTLGDSPSTENKRKYKVSRKNVETIEPNEGSMRRRRPIKSAGKNMLSQENPFLREN